MYNCPNCSGNLSFDIASQKLMCDFCQTQFDPYEYQKSQDAEQSDVFGVTVFTCPQCGGEIMTTNVTAAGFCTYCGASTILDSRMSEEKRPAHIIPFTHTKEDCRKAYSSLVKRALFAAREFRDPAFLDRFRGIYMPYWVYNYKMDGGLHLKGTKEYRRGDYEITEHYDLTGDVDAVYEGLNYDASSSFDDTVASAIAPFAASKMQPFTPSILCGFYADAPDVRSSVYDTDVRDAICEDSLDRLSGVPEYRANGVSLPETETFRKSLSSYGLNLRSEEPVCAYLPVWFLTYRKNDRVAYAVMNGSTGKITADLPIDGKKYLLGSLLLALPIFAALAFFFTITGRVLLLLSSITAVISLILYAFEVSAISDKETHAKDKGFSFEGNRKTAKKSSSKAKEKEKEGSSKGSKGITALVQKYGMFLLFLVFFVLVGLKPLTGYVLDDRPFNLYSIYAIVSSLALIGIVYAAFSFAETETSRKHIFLHTIGSGFAVIAAAAILAWNPVSDLWYYGGSILAAAGVCLTFLGLIRKYNVLATRPLPTFYDRQGGNDRAK